MIPNHYSATLSDLDLKMVLSVPPGGNWKDIPETIPSKRLDQIRLSYKQGRGSRSSYYGRMRHDEPAHTVSTYFNRPGNGRFIHYSQDRVISQREAARLQSFPDSFIFCGSKTSINKQIGNAVPPLLAYQIARSLGEAGAFVDLFCGCGGLSLGFKWAGWNHLYAVDIDKAAVSSFQHNISNDALVGDLRSDDVRATLVSRSSNRQKANKPLIVLGGPPCQGFSTAGNRRSMDDERNHLFRSYASVLRELRPDMFLFENVPGLKSMEGGLVLKQIRYELEKVGYSVQVHTIGAHEYGVPQRRTRVLLLGVRLDAKLPILPVPVTAWDSKQLSLELPSTPSVSEAISDLPPIEPAQDGSDLDYISRPLNRLQAFFRDEINAAELYHGFKEELV
ncbi:DNA (cytosine-5-)-methyltransferase [Ruegeria sp. Alg231-54]|uniref:DNA (cytosine-5-)-methyltransferase n=1 Tax=Ruegeria sp. Alg231-54 TaxID=1922221 RepID=UPI000D5500D5|nr:DNA (cytosine-5-)-methyltransferase [Ruegeria sp. Alg231-54]